MACPTCVGIDCLNPADLDLYNLESSFFTNPRLTFVVNCPSGYDCHGFDPVPITIPPDTIRFPVGPQPGELRLRCCQSEIVRFVPGGATAAQIAAIANAMILECARQQAECDRIDNPPDEIPPPTRFPQLPPDLTNCISPPASSTVCIGSPYNATLRVTCPGITSPISWGLVSGAWPDGLAGAVNPNDSRRFQITGTPTTGSNATVIVQARGSNGLITRITLHLRVVGINSPSILPAASVGDIYAYQLQAFGGTTPFVFSLVSGSLPDGLRLDPDGLITGTPTGGSVSNGIDPILGPPFPPINYQMFAHPPPQQPRLDWTIPDLLIRTQYVVSPKQVFLYVLNYFQDPTVASQALGVVTVSGGIFRFIDTATNAGQQIRWKHGEISTVQTVISPTQANVLPSQTVTPASEFAVLPPGILFELYHFEGDDWIKVGDSTNTMPQPRADWLNSEFTGTEVEAFEAASVAPVGNNFFYIKATSGGVSVYSPTRKITVT